MPVVPNELDESREEKTWREGDAGASYERAPIGVGVLLSGTGRTLENLLRAIAAAELNASIRVVVSSKPDVRGLEIARDAGIPAVVIQRRDFDSEPAYSAAVYAAIRPHAVELLLLAGFLRKLVVPSEWEGRILNIHPALLPEMAAAAGKGFYGDRVHAAVTASGAAESGATVHVVDNGYDTGPVVMRATVPVLPDDTPALLAARVFAAECVLYPAAIRQYVTTHPELFGG
jgi:phosphoribosylglycinamide formyltransferase-1